MYHFNNQVIFEQPFQAETPLRIDKIEIIWEEDIHPDLSFLGSFSRTPAEHHIDLQERGLMQAGDFRYFNLGGGDPAYIEQDYKRIRDYYAGKWCMFGCTALAVVSYPIGQGNRRIQIFKSGGLWGIESDSELADIKDIEQEQLEDLKDHLSHFNVEWPENVKI